MADRLPWPPCPVMATGQVCGATEERPTVLHPIHGVVCAVHFPSLVTPKKKAEAAHA